MNIKTESNKYGKTTNFNKSKKFLLKNGNNYFGKDFNNNKETRGIAIFFWIKLNLFFALIFLINKIKIWKKAKKKVFNTKNIKKKYDIIDFNEIVPKISLRNNNVPSLEEIFNSRTLFLFNSNLSVEYLRYIRAINDEEEKQFKKQYYEYETAISAKIFEKRED